MEVCNSIPIQLSEVSVLLVQAGRFDNDVPKVSGHKSNVLDLAWNPFDDHVIASASEDTVVKVWRIPDGGLTKVLEDGDEICTLQRHQRKVS